MGRLKFEKVIQCFSIPLSPTSCLCFNSVQDEYDNFIERDSLIKKDHKGQILKLRDVLEPKTVVLRVSMHCNGCARKVEKHIKKIEGVTSFSVEKESKRVTVTGDIDPFEVLESVSKIKFAEIIEWTNNTIS